MYSMEDIENMCKFDVNKMSYSELEIKYDELNTLFLYILNDRNFTIVKDYNSLKTSCTILLNSMASINVALDYHCNMGKGRRNAI